MSSIENSNDNSDTDTDTETEIEAKKRGRPPSAATSHKPRVRTNHVQVVGDTQPEAEIPGGGVIAVIPTMNVVLTRHRRSYSTGQKAAVAAYASLIGRNKAADELNLNRALVGKWMKLHPTSTNPEQLNPPLVANVVAGLIVEQNKRAASHRVIFPRDLTMQHERSDCDSASVKRKKKYKGKKKKKKKARVEEVEPSSSDKLPAAETVSEATSSLGSSLGDGSSSDSDDNDFMNEYINVDGGGGDETSFETAFAAIREAARVAIAGNLHHS
ncbi:UNVERIFIED_CONTAM: hypothetical protein HDU68_002927 [Siphonaria sp. JEL0065]|nr:hypothetical protein HDU68_002927 [Siphonaria sp. JEL0065]